jgi:inorganic pyrophosphatase
VLLEVIPIGGLEMSDDKGSDLKIIAAAAGDQSVKHLREYTDIAEHRRIEIEHFFETYKLLEEKGVTIGKWINAADAHESILRASVAYQAAK